MDDAALNGSDDYFSISFFTTVPPQNLTMKHKKLNIFLFSVSLQRQIN